MLDEDKHLFNVSELIHFTIEEENPILPNQMPATPRQVSDITVSCDQPHCPSLLLKLAVDASPGCGGIAWPAGCVSASFLLVFRPSRFLPRLPDPCKYDCLLEHLFNNRHQSSLIGLSQLLMQPKNPTRAQRR
ncbi:hypothetical protein JB92DRAFT_1923352 [Gautieria morchelliformis]|nr:hypothetical protein JB92DRAFT_1923352 [Gautieria morchelliformis]